MMRFWLMACGGLSLVACTGQNIEGRWKGALPYADANDCRIRIRTDDTFDLACAKDVWVGAGRYDYDGKSLVLNYTLLTKRGKPIEHPPALGFRVEGSGNALTLTDPDRRTFTWHRTYGKG